jgi:hypothetical protein
MHWKSLTLGLATAAVIAVAVPSAHHSFTAEYDR